MSLPAKESTAQRVMKDKVKTISFYKGMMIFGTSDMTFPKVANHDFHLEILGAVGVKISKKNEKKSYIVPWNFIEKVELESDDGPQN